jgi:hypothetical protein
MASEDQLPGFSTRCESLKLSDPGGFSLVDKRLAFSERSFATAYMPERQEAGSRIGEFLIRDRRPS